MAVFNIADGSALGFPSHPGAVTVVRKTVDIAAQIKAGNTAGIGDIFTVCNIPAGALAESEVVYVQTVDPAGAAAFSLQDSGGAANLIAASSAAALVPFANVTQKFYATADRVDFVCVKAMTVGKFQVVVTLTNCSAGLAQ